VIEISLNLSVHFAEKNMQLNARQLCNPTYIF